MPAFSTTSAQRLLTCHPDLQRLFREVIQHVDCTILCGHRGEADQDAAFAAGTSRDRWPTSRHNSAPSEAVDVAPYPVDWTDIPRFGAFAAIVRECAARLGITVEWGGDFPHLRDYVHWQLPRT